MIEWHTHYSMNVYLEIGQKRIFAGAVDWPGWCRSGRDETSALQALFDYRHRYARVLQRARLGFQEPTDESAFVVVERLKGNTTTDFGAPDVPPSGDSMSISSAELLRFEKLLRACWRAFDASVKTATGKTLRTGPRGGGRQVDAITQHVLGANAGYLNQIGWKFQQADRSNLARQLKQTEQATLKALKSAAHGKIPARGPRGGLRWTPRYFVRRVAWHILVVRQS